jgi:transposase-like protein
VLGIYISKERNMLIAEKFIRSLVEKLYLELFGVLGEH